MKNIWSEKIDQILSTGVGLDNIGILNWALDRKRALVALDELAAAGVPVLGGDVYKFNNTTIESTYDNWYCERLNQETNQQFIERSIEKSRNYILSYISMPDTALFAIIPDVSECSFLGN